MRDAGADEGIGDRCAVVVDPDEIAAGTDALGIGIGAAPPGTYVLRYSAETELTADVGALGRHTFDAGTYAYVGSAFGSNGLGRVDRHRRVAAGEHDVQHWHVDYFASHPAVSLESVLAAPTAAIECQLATGLRNALAASITGSTIPVAGFGSSDCDCGAHLLAAADAGTLESVVEEVCTQTVRE